MQSTLCLILKWVGQVSILDLSRGHVSDEPSSEIMVLLQRAKRFIESHLDSPELSIDVICNAVGTSRRTLYRLFDREGGVHRYVQARRLERIRTLLTDPRETRRIAELAADFGFPRSDHFARAFKHQYGLSARDLRLEARQPLNEEPGIPLPNAKREHGFEDWFKELRG